MAIFCLYFALAAVGVVEIPADRTVFDFLRGEDAWVSINDTVMGGRSRSAMRVDDGKAVFAGTVSLDNNGGFASVRSQPGRHDLAGYDGVVIRVRGDGRQYGLRTRTDRRYDGVAYHVLLEPGDGEWQEIRVSFETFVPVYRGRRVPGHPALDPSSIQSFGLMISRKQEGPFRLEIDWIKAYAEPK